MLSRIDEIIYPNRCEVIEFTGPQRFVYPIFKNGSSSLYEQAKISKSKIHLNGQITKLDNIHIILRNPVDRFISGINEFVFFTLKSNPTLDVNTIMYFVENYLFLDRHYAPQMAWIVNLSRFLNANCKMKFNSMEDIKLFTNIRHESKHQQILSADKMQELKTNTHAQIYFRLDQILIDLIDQEFTFAELRKHIETKDKIAFQKINALS